MIGKIWIKSWSAFLVSYYYIPFLLLLSKVDLIHQNEKMREFLKFKATQTTSLLLLCDFFVVSQWRSFIKWQRIFRFLAELFKGEFYNLPPLYNYWQTCLIDILQWLRLPLGVVHKLCLQDEVGHKMSTICERSYCRTCHCRRVGGQKIPKNCQRSLWTTP